MWPFSGTELEKGSGAWSERSPGVRAGAQGGVGISVHLAALWAAASFHQQRQALTSMACRGAQGEEPHKSIRGYFSTVALVRQTQRRVLRAEGMSSQGVSW